MQVNMHMSTKTIVIGKMLSCIKPGIQLKYLEKQGNSTNQNSFLGRQPSYFTLFCWQTILRWQPAVNYVACCLH